MRSSGREVLNLEIFMFLKIYNLWDLFLLTWLTHYVGTYIAQERLEVESHMFDSIDTPTCNQYNM